MCYTLLIKYSKNSITLFFLEYVVFSFKTLIFLNLCLKKKVLIS